MELSKDYEELFKILNKYKVKYLIVGGYAVIYYTEPRYTKDVDVWIKSDEKNAGNIFKALHDFGAPLIGVTSSDFTRKDLIYQVGVAPIRVDIIMGLKSVDFDTAWKKRKKVKYGNVPINIIDKKHLIKSKKAIKRKQDILDLEKLTLRKSS